MASFLTSILGRSETYTKATRRVGAVEVSISYPLGPANNHIPDLIVRSINEAQRWLGLALREVRDYEASRNASEFYRERFAYSFGVQPTVQYSHEVSGVLEKINKGLSCGRLAIKVMDKKGRGGGVKGTVSANQLYFDAKLDSEIELDIGRLLSMPKRSTKTLIHEAGHVFGHLVDYAYADLHADADHLDWFDRSGNQAPKKLDLEWDRAKRNADSYAMFVFRLSRPRVGPAIV
jgi:hypothetical protein